MTPTGRNLSSNLNKTMLSSKCHSKTSKQHQGVTPQLKTCKKSWKYKQKWPYDAKRKASNAYQSTWRNTNLTQLGTFATSSLGFFSRTSSFCSSTFSSTNSTCWQWALSSFICGCATTPTWPWTSAAVAPTYLWCLWLRWFVFIT